MNLLLVKWLRTLLFPIVYSDAPHTDRQLNAEHLDQAVRILNEF
jgi:hypothetical protein